MLLMRTTAAAAAAVNNNYVRHVNTVVGPHDARVNKAATLLDRPAAPGKPLLVEGPKLLAECVKRGLKVDFVFHEKRWLQDAATRGTLPVFDPGTVLLPTAPAALRRLSQRTNRPLSTVAVVHAPRAVTSLANAWPPSSGRLPLVLVCDRMRDAGNLGSALRAAHAAGCIGAVTTPGSADMWSLPALRAGAGAQLHLPLISRLAWPQLQAAVGGPGPPSWKPVLADGNCEGLAIEYNNNSSSSSSSDISIANSGSSSSSSSSSNGGSSGGRGEIGSSSNYSGCISNRGEPVQQPVATTTQPWARARAHWDIDWTSGPRLVIVGSEGSGLSREARDFCVRHNGEIAYVPMPGGANSLNAATAAAVLLFEAVRQLS